MIKIKTLSKLGASLILSLASLLCLQLPAAHALTIITCTWTGGGTDSNFSTAGNWSGCNGGAPVVAAGTSYTLIFPDLNSINNESAVDDVSGLEVNTITFTAANTSYNITGSDPIELDDGISNTGTAEQSLGMDITLTGNENFAATSGTISIGSPTGIDIGSNSLTLSGSNSVDLVSPIIGSGSLIVSNSFADYLEDASPNFSGPINVTSGELYDSSDGALGSGSVTVANGSTLVIDSSTDTENLTNNLTLAGTGVSNQGALALCLDNDAACDGDNDNTNLTLSGDITLTGDTQFGVDSYVTPGTGTQTVTITGALSGAYTLTAVPNSNVVLSINSSNNTSNTPNSTDSSSDSSADVGTPDTGLAAVRSNPIAVLAATLVATTSLLLISRRLRATK